MWRGRCDHDNSLQQITPVSSCIMNSLHELKLLIWKHKLTSGYFEICGWWKQHPRSYIKLVVLLLLADYNIQNHQNHWSKEVEETIALVTPHDCTHTKGWGVLWQRIHIYSTCALGLVCPMGIRSPDRYGSLRSVKLTEWIADCCFPQIISKTISRMTLAAARSGHSCAKVHWNLIM